MLKPIEPGCRCLAYASDLTIPQECVAENFHRADEFVTDFDGYIDRIAVDCWRVEPPLDYISRSGKLVQSAFCPAYAIMRIDGDEEQFKAEQDVRIAEKMLCGIDG